MMVVMVVTMQSSWLQLHLLTCLVAVVMDRFGGVIYVSHVMAVHSAKGHLTFTRKVKAPQDVALCAVGQTLWPIIGVHDVRWRECRGNMRLHGAR